MEATVKVVLDRYVALRLGDQELHIPWGDLRARAVARYHGERIVVGVRPEALLPVPMDSPGDVLRGRIRHLEHHGHESLAFVDVGATAVVVDEMTDAGQRPDAGHPRAAAVHRPAGRVAHPGRRPRDDGDSSARPSRRRPAQPQAGGTGGAARAVPGVTAGHPLAVAVRTDALHFFEESGARIDVGHR